MSDPIEFSCEGAVATVVLNRPDEGNAIDLPLAQELVQCVINCDQDPDIRCVVLTGRGRFFCVGGDLGAFTAAGGAVSGFISELAGTLHLAVSRLMRMNKPLLVLVNGPAAGAGFSLAMAGDVVLAARSAHFTPAYGAVGLSPDGGLTWHLPRLIGMRRAQELLLLNRRVPAKEAGLLGLVTDVLDDEVLDRSGRETAQLLAESATGAVAATRRLLLDTYGGGLEAHLEMEARNIAAQSGGEEGREGTVAFAEKRPPRFH